jgi:hypothetical protein
LPPRAAGKRAASIVQEFIFIKAKTGIPSIAIPLRRGET